MLGTVLKAPRQVAVEPVRRKAEEHQFQRKKAVLGACVEAWQPSSKMERRGSGCGNKCENSRCWYIVRLVLQTKLNWFQLFEYSSFVFPVVEMQGHAGHVLNNCQCIVITINKCSLFLRKTWEAFIFLLQPLRGHYIHILRGIIANLFYEIAFLKPKQNSDIVEMRPYYIFHSLKPDCSHSLQV